MAERLTEKHKISCFEYDLVNFEHKVKEFNDYDAFYAYNMAVRKLGKLEDILEKYSIESVEELEKEMHSLMLIISILNDYGIEDYNELDEILKEFSYMKKIETEIGKELKFYKTDRDTWKRACELACDVLRDINYKIYNEDRIDFENTFYQQAKKEGNDDK